MADTADQLAAAIRQLIDDAVQAALKAQQPPAPLPSERTRPLEELPQSRALYPLRDIQQMLGISRSTVYQLLSNGQLPSVKVGRRFVTAAALRAYIDGLR